MNLQAVTTETPFTRVVDLLEGVQRTRTGVKARCPAHDDRSPSLSVDEGRNGVVLLRCWAGCKNEDIRRALGLEWADLFPPSDKRVRARRRLRNAAKEQRISLPASVVDALLSGPEFVKRWELAKALALLDPALQKQDLLANWDYLVDNDCDIPASLELASLIRGVALFRYGDQLSRHKPVPEIPDDAVYCYDEGFSGPRILAWRDNRWERIVTVPERQENPLDISECVERLITELER